jgi:hypothetical protein
MATNAVQIVLNSQNYVHKQDVPPGGGNKDFYAGRDAEFVAHRAQISSQLTQLALQQPTGKMTLQYAHVELDDSAWAKSHRPTKALFSSAKVRTIGGNELGSLIVELTPEDLNELPNKVLSAEAATRWLKNTKTGKVEAKPSRLRSEIGGIKSIRAYGPQDRRKFTVEQALTWLSDPRTGGVYYVETFVSAEEMRHSQRDVLEAALLSDFRDGLQLLRIPLEISSTRTEWGLGTIFVIKVADGATKPAQTRAVHLRLVDYLDRHPVVRAILLPPILQSSAVGAGGTEPANIPLPVPGDSYPIIGVIDTGVSAASGLEPWSAGAVHYVDGSLQDHSHGTFIAGLASGGSALNSDPVFAEVACKYYDLGLHPTSDYESYFPRGFLDFLEQLDVEIGEAKKAGVRIFNMSLSVTLPVEDSNYSIFANALDQLADKHDILFVLPAGNLDGSAFRDEWPAGPDDCLKMLAEYRHQGKDRIFQPADSLRSLVVGAIDLPLADGTRRPSRYTRRGPGPSWGAKPDMAHVGGNGDGDAGLISVSPDGRLTSNRGTSFASPLVAKTLAVLEHAIEGPVPLETLIALTIHNAEIPNKLRHRKLVNIARDFVGAGIPKVAANTLVGADAEITLVFNGTLCRGQELLFDFAWPSCLVSSDGVCRGTVNLTLVYRPPIDRRYGAEFVLVNLDAWLRQEVIDRETGEVTYKSRLKNQSDYGIEKERVAHGAKWWPVKRFEQTFSRGVGNSSQWRLVVESLCRSEYAIDEAGIPFTAVLTISDPNGEEDVFAKVRRQLTAAGVQVADIQIALSSRLRARAGR